VLQAGAEREEKRLAADIDRAEELSRTRVELVNGIILKKTFLWTGLFSELEKALPGPSYITALSPSFTADGSVTMHIRVTSRSLDDLMAFITNLTARGFKSIQVGGETRSDEGRLIAEIDLKYERAL
jgi:Tfp pilus assembly protein PilN